MGVRARLTAASVVAVALVLAAMAVGVVALQRRSLMESLDEALSDEVAGLAEAVAADGEGADLTVRGDDDLVAQVVVDGQVVAGSPDEPLAPLDDAAEGIEDDEVQLSTTGGVADLDGDQRVASVAVILPDGRPATVAVAAPLDDVDESTRALAVALAVVVPLALGVLAVLVWWLVGRALRPVESIRREVADIEGHEIHRRVPVPATDDEIGRLARTMNALLDRLEAAARRQQAFVADASHELRTPLTRMRSELEVDLAHPSTADPGATHRSVLEEVDTLQRLVDDLLVLARLDGADPARPAATVDAGDLVAEEVAALAGGPPVAVSPARPGTAVVLGDATQLRRALRNVLENAVRHAVAAVEVDVTVTDARPGDDEATGRPDDPRRWVRITVDDDGPGIPADDRDRVFERFAQVDAARSGGQAGLGLAIARDIVVRHRGRITVEDAPLGGARLRLDLPAATPHMS